MELDTKSLQLRHTINQDLHDFTALVTLPAYGRLSPFGSMNKDGAQKIFEKITQYDQKTHAFWTVLDKKTNNYAGFVGYHPVIFEDTTHTMFFIGFNRRFWGSDFPLEAAKVVCQYAFNAVKIPRFIAFVHPEDVESLYIAQTLGSHFEKQCMFFDVTVLLFSLVPTLV